MIALAYTVWVCSGAVGESFLDKPWWETRSTRPLCMHIPGVTGVVYGVRAAFGLVCLHVIAAIWMHHHMVWLSCVLHCAALTAIHCQNWNIALVGVWALCFLVTGHFALAGRHDVVGLQLGLGAIGLGLFAAVSLAATVPFKHAFLPGPQPDRWIHAMAMGAAASAGLVVAAVVLQWKLRLSRVWDGQHVRTTLQAVQVLVRMCRAKD